MNQFSYSNFGQQMTGFDNSIDHSLFGHWSNPEYQEMCQGEDLIDEYMLLDAINIELNEVYDLILKEYNYG